MLAQRDDPRVARGRAGFDDEQRVAGLLPHQFGERASFAIADFADQVARHDEVGGIRLHKRSTGFAAFIADVAQPRAVPCQVQRQCAQCGVGVQQRKALQRWERFSGRPGRRSRPGADIEQACSGRSPA